MSTARITETTTPAYVCQKCTPEKIAAHLSEVAALFDSGEGTPEPEDSRAHIPFATFELYARLVFNREYAGHYVKPEHAPVEAFETEYETLEHLGLITIDTDDNGKVEQYVLNWFESEGDYLGTIIAPENPADIIAHLLKVAEHILRSTDDTESTADMFQQYLEVFAARECQSDFTPLENLNYPGSYRELEDIGLLTELVDNSGAASAYLLTMLAEGNG